jgi:hypothetical protein
MKADSFLRNLRDATANSKATAVAEASVGSPSPKRQRQEQEQPFRDDMPEWAVRKIDDKGDVFQLGPWRVDVRQKVEGEVKHDTDGRKELERYINMATCFGCESKVSESVYAQKLKAIVGKDGCECGAPEGEAFGWGCCMTVIRLPADEGGCLLYSPVLDDEQKLDKIHKFLEAERLLPVKYLVCPTPQHHLCLREYRDAFPSAFMFCTETRGGVMPPCHKRRRDLNFDCILHPEPAGGEFVDWKPPAVRFSYGDKVTNEKSAARAARRSIAEHKRLLEKFLDIFTVEDNRTTEIVLIHKPSSVLVLSDLLYKSSSRDELKGPGGERHRYSFPKWFAQGQEDLFYKLKNDNSNGLLPAYRTHPSYRKIDLDGCRMSIERVLESVGRRDVQSCVTCHTDPIIGQQKIVDTLKRAWAFLL